MIILFAAFLLLAPMAAHAQYKVSEIVAKGGQVLTAEQARQTLAGSKVSGLTDTGLQFEFEFSPSGKLEGMMYTPRGASGVIGTWTVTLKNQVCTQFEVLISRNQVQRCGWYWKAGDEYYATSTGMDDVAAEKFVDCLLSGGNECDGRFNVVKRNVRK